MIICRTAKALPAQECQPVCVAGLVLLGPIFHQKKALQSSHIAAAECREQVRCSKQLIMSAVTAEQQPTWEAIMPSPRYLWLRPSQVRLPAFLNR